MLKFSVPWCVLPIDAGLFVDYCHINLVKYGLVGRVSDWPYLSFHRYVERGIYKLDWATFPTIDTVVGKRG